MASRCDDEKKGANNDSIEGGSDHTSSSILSCIMASGTTNADDETSRHLIESNEKQRAPPTVVVGSSEVTKVIREDYDQLARLRRSQTTAPLSTTTTNNNQSSAAEVKGIQNQHDISVEEENGKEGSGTPIATARNIGRVGKKDIHPLNDQTSRLSNLETQEKSARAKNFAIEDSGEIRSTPEEEESPRQGGGANPTTLTPGTTTFHPGAYAISGTEQNGLMDSHRLDDEDEARNNGEGATTNNNATESGMAVANLVQEDCQDVEDLPQAEGIIDLESSIEMMTEEKKQQQQWGIPLSACLVLVVLLAVIVVFVPDWGYASEDDVPQLANNDDRSPSPSVSPTMSLSGYVESLLPNHTLVALQDPESPQTLAYNWMMEDPSLMTYSSERIIQRFSLGVFYYSTGGPGWRNTNGWLSYEEHECSWFASDTVTMLFASGILHDLPAVYTDTVLPRVNESSPCQDPENDEAYTHLMLVLNNLKGSIPPELYMLTSLKGIFLALNPDLTGPGLPSEIIRLSSLEKLFLTGAQLTGTIPTEITSLSNLNLLHYGSNLLEGTIPKELGLLSDSLEVLDIFGNRFTGTIPPQLGSLKELLLLNIHENKGLAGTIPSQLGMLGSISFISLSKTRRVGSLPSELGMLESVQHIYLYSNNLSGPVPSELTNLVTHGKLQLLFLFDNVLSGSVPEELCSIETVTETAASGQVKNQSLIGCYCNCTYEHWKGTKICSPLPARCAP